MRNVIASFFLLFFVVGCAGTDGSRMVVPETANERLAAAEVTYEGAVTSIRDLITVGVVKPGTETGDKLAKGIITARLALDAWGAAPNDPTAMSTALTALKALQSVLAAAKASIDQ
jgi:hypothetical protein